jgi:hypothetical protein
MIVKKFYYITSKSSWHRHASRIGESHASELKTGEVLLVTGRRVDEFEAEGDVQTLPWLHSTDRVEAGALAKLNDSFGFDLPQGSRIGDVVVKFGQLSKMHDPTR